jgi:hypothetical protein
MQTLEQRQAFYDRLNRHDWLYEYSDDGSVYAKGNAEHRALQSVRTASPENATMYLAFQDYHFGKYSKPERPI